MSKKMNLQLECDFCHTKETFPADKPLTQEQSSALNHWVNVQAKNGQENFTYCRSRCASNGLKVMADDVSPVAIDSAATVGQA